MTRRADHVPPSPTVSKGSGELGIVNGPNAPNHAPGGRPLD
jgi:hypothetical protein